MRLITGTALACAGVACAFGMTAGAAGFLPTISTGITVPTTAPSLTTVASLPAVTTVASVPAVTTVVSVPSLTTTASLPPPPPPPPPLTAPLPTPTLPAVTATVAVTPPPPVPVPKITTTVSVSVSVPPASVAVPAVPTAAVSTVVSSVTRQTAPKAPAGSTSPTTTTSASRQSSTPVRTATTAPRSTSQATPVSTPGGSPSTPRAVSTPGVVSSSSARRRVSPARARRAGVFSRPLPRPKARQASGAFIFPGRLVGKALRGSRSSDNLAGATRAVSAADLFLGSAFSGVLAARAEQTAAAPAQESGASGAGSSRRHRLGPLPVITWSEAKPGVGAAAFVGALVLLSLLLFGIGSVPPRVLRRTPVPVRVFADVQPDVRLVGLAVLLTAAFVYALSVLGA